MTRSAVLLIAALLLWAAPARAAKPARFQAGAVVRSLAPPVPVYAGGFGTSPPITSQHDPLQARAMVIRNGSRAVGFAIVDAQAYFAAYQEDPRVGITAVREDAAAAIARATGVRMTADDIIVQSTHSHAAPTLEGIWGPVPPAYLKLVHDRTVDALVAAARRARPALLQSGTVDAPFLDNVAIQQTDSYPGWTQDGQLSVLRAVAPRSRRTIATFANVPAHADIVCGSCLKTLSADYFGAVRAALDRRLGGTSLVTPATLGREESPVQTAGLEAMTWYARGVSGLVARALARARWVTDPTLAGAGAMTDIPGTNPLLLALVAANRLPAGAKQSFADQSGQYPIDRADAPPYLTGSVIGTPLSAVRVGDLAYLSMPGEPFPEIRDALRRATGPRARLVVALSKGQDDLGYFYPAFVTPFTSTYPSDHLEFNVAPQAGDQILLGQAANLRAVGFDATTPVGRPLPTDTGAASRPAVQALAAPAAGDVGRGGTFTTTLGAIASEAYTDPAALPPTVRWDFGDGTTADTPFLDFSDSRAHPFTTLRHAFRVGVHDVKLSMRDAKGRPATFTVRVTAFPRLRPRVAVRRLGGGRRVRLRARVTGGDGRVLAWRWRFSDGTVAAGRTVRHRRVRRATLTVVDGTGSSRSVRVRLR